MKSALGPSLVAALRDAGIAADERGLMPLADARRLVAGLSVFEKAPSDETNILGADTAWAALLSLEDVGEFLQAWSADRCGRPDSWGEELSPSASDVPRGPGATPHADQLLARGWPHGVRLLHQHPHNDTPGPVFDWLMTQPGLPLRSFWAREIAARFVRHAGADPQARDKGGWVLPREGARILGTVLASTRSRLSPLASEHVTLLLEAFLGAPALWEAVHAVLAAIPEADRAKPSPDGFHAVLALGWVARRSESKASKDSIAALQQLAATFPASSDLGRALALALPDQGGLGAVPVGRTPSEWLLKSAREGAACPAGPLPLDLQFVAALGEAACDAWEAQEIPATDRGWFASELALLGGPRARALAAALQSPS